MNIPNLNIFIIFILFYYSSNESKSYLIRFLHLPHNIKSEGMKRIENIVNNHIDDRYNRKKILIDHNVEDTIETTLELGMWSGLSIYPIIKLSPD